MSLTIPDPYGLSASDALTLASERGLWPTFLGSREIAEAVPAAVRERAVFSARTTNAVYLSALKQRIERYLAAGYEGDRASLRVELKQELARLGYTPEAGFPGDAELGIPPAMPGSLRDLSSERRINLILDTQLRLMTGKAQRAAGMDAMAIERYPAWELVRTEDRAKPREWAKRWVESGGLLYQGRMIALKGAEVWSLLGDSALWKDALGVDHPPFAFQSGMGWEQVDEDECLELGVIQVATSEPELAPAPAPELGVEDVVPPATVRTDGLDAGILQRLRSKFGGLLQTAKRLTWDWVFGR